MDGSGSCHRHGDYFRVRSESVLVLPGPGARASDHDLVQAIRVVKVKAGLQATFAVGDLPVITVPAAASLSGWPGALHWRRSLTVLPSRLVSEVPRHRGACLALNRQTWTVTWIRP